MLFLLFMILDYNEYIIDMKRVEYLWIQAHILSWVSV